MEVTYPGSREAVVTDKFCGSSIPETIISSSNSMIVEFVSDYSVTKSGFSAVWSRYDEDIWTNEFDSFDVIPAIQS